MSQLDYDITIDADSIGDFRELIRAGLDALGGGEEEESIASLGREILAKIS